VINCATTNWRIDQRGGKGLRTGPTVAGDWCTWPRRTSALSLPNRKEAVAERPQDRRGRIQLAVRDCARKNAHAHITRMGTVLGAMHEKETSSAR